MSKVFFMSIFTVITLLMTACTPSLPKDETVEKIKDLSDCYTDEDTKDYAVKRPKLITSGQKREFENYPYMSKDITFHRMEKYHILGYFLSVFERYNQLNIDYKLFNRIDKLQGYDNAEFHLNNDGLRNISYYFYESDERRKLPNLHTLSDKERQEILPLFHVVTDNPQKSQEILAELEKIYQDKLHRKEFLEDGIIVADVEYNGRLFELFGQIKIDNEKPHCSVDRLVRLSIN